MPNHQLGFTVGVGCADALFALASILSDSEATGDQLVIGFFMSVRLLTRRCTRRSFQKFISKCLNLCIVRVFYYMYNNRRAQIETTSNPVVSLVVPVCKGVRQGSVVSAKLYNNSDLPAQARVATSCISKGIDVSLMTYADDLLNLNRSADRLSKNFDVLNREHNNVCLSFNVSKPALLFFTAKQKSICAIQL